MTNTGDFRRYSYNSDVAYAVKAFDNRREAAAPSYIPEPKRNLKVRGERSGKKSRAQLLSEQKAGFKKTVIISVTAIACLAMFFCAIHTYAQKNELSHEITSLQTELAVAESENTRLNSEINSLVSMSMIDEYAVDKLGMTKVKSNQIKYIDVSSYKTKRRAAAQALLKQEQAKSKAVKDSTHN